MCVCIERAVCNDICSYTSIYNSSEIIPCKLQKKLARLATSKENRLGWRLNFHCVFPFGAHMTK